MDNMEARNEEEERKAIVCWRRDAITRARTNKRWRCTIPACITGGKRVSEDGIGSVGDWYEASYKNCPGYTAGVCVLHVLPATGTHVLVQQQERESRREVFSAVRLQAMIMIPDKLVK